MIFVSREEIEREIALQKLVRETEASQLIIKKSFKKKKAFKKREPKKRTPYKTRKKPKIIPKKKVDSHVQDSVIRIIKRIGPLTRDELVNTLNIPRTTLFDNLDILFRKNILEKHSKNIGKRGRPFILWGVVDSKK